MWFWLALTFAILSSINVLIYKNILKRSDEYVVAWISSIFTLPVLALIVLLFYQIPRVDWFFAFGIIGTVSLNVMAGILSFRAIKLTDISLIAPISAFNPVFTTLISFFTLKETPDLKGVIGIATIVIGAYVLNLTSFKDGIFVPFKKLFSHKGVVLALICNFIWGITPVFEKIAIKHTFPQVPPFVSLVGSFSLAVAFWPIMLKKSRSPLTQIRIHLRSFLLAGVFGGIAGAAGFTAYSLTKLGYATAIFKLSMIFTVIWGYLFLKEPAIKEKLLGSVIMLIGVLLLVL